jgi:hypothetical protein
MPTAQTPYSLRAFFPIPCVIVSSWHWEGLWPTNDHGVSEDVKILHEMGSAQELSRRMGAFQNFAISFAIICVVAGGLTAFPAALSAGGGAANRRHVGGRQHLRAGRGGGHGPGCPVLPDRRRDLSLGFDLRRPRLRLGGGMVQSAIIVAILLFVLHDKRFNGPPIGEEIKRRQAAIAAAEKAMSATG